jgi:ATP synthase protein I
VKRVTATEQINSAVGESWVEGGSFLSSILAGMLLGYLADRWLGTDPWLIVLGISAGAYSGFMRIWHYSKRIEDDPRER